MSKVARRLSRLDVNGRRALRPLVELLDRRELLSGYNVRLNSPSEIGTSIAGQSQHYDHLADFQATDPNGVAVSSKAGFVATVDWKDGQTTSVDITANYLGLPGLFDISGDHAFPNPSNGEYSVQVVLTDPGGGIWYGRPSTATVNPRPNDLVVSPIGTDSFSVTTGQPLQGEVATIQAADPSVPLTGLTGVFDNGDGTQTPAQIAPANPGPGFVVTDPHPFTRPGTFFIVLQLNDDQGDRPRLLQGHVTVTVPAPTPSPQPIDNSPTITGANLISPRAQQVLGDILQAVGLRSATVTSGVRTAAQQARIMYDNIRARGVPYELSVYGPAGDMVIAVYASNRSLPRNRVIQLMTQKINEVGPYNVSHHISDRDVFDVGQSSIPTGARSAFKAAARRNSNVSRLLIENHAFHFELR